MEEYLKSKQLLALLLLMTGGTNCIILFHFLYCEDWVTQIFQQVINMQVLFIHPCKHHM